MTVFPKTPSNYPSREMNIDGMLAQSLHLGFHAVPCSCRLRLPFLLGAPHRETRDVANGNWSAIEAGLAGICLATDRSSASSGGTVSTCHIPGHCSLPVEGSSRSLSGILWVTVGVAGWSWVKQEELPATRPASPLGPRQPDSLGEHLSAEIAVSSVFCTEG